VASVKNFHGMSGLSSIDNALVRSSAVMLRPIALEGWLCAPGRSRVSPHSPPFTAGRAPKFMPR